MKRMACDRCRRVGRLACTVEVLDDRHVWSVSMCAECRVDVVKALVLPEEQFGVPGLVAFVDAVLDDDVDDAEHSMACGCEDCAGERRFEQDREVRYG